MIFMMPTTRQARFINEFLIDGNGTAAAIRAGYVASSAHVTASRMLRNAKVSEAIAARRSELSDIFRIRRQDVIKGVLDAIDRARLAGEPATEINGWKEVAKLMGFYAPEVLKVHLGDDQQRLQKKFEAMSDAELLEMTLG